MTLLQDRVKIIRDAISFEKTDRIPTHSNYYTYMILDAGYKLGEAVYDYDMMYDAVTRFHEKYEFDYYNYIGMRNPFAVVREVDGYWYEVDDSRDSINVKDPCIMREDEYPQLIENPMKYIWEVYIPRKCKALNGPNAKEAILRAADAQIEYNNFASRMNAKFLNDYQSPNRGFGNIRTPFDLLFNWMRGIKNISIDLRRRYSQVLEATAALEDFYGVAAGFATFEREMPESFLFGANAVWLGHSILSVKQFSDIYWPVTKKTIEKCVETNRQFNIFCESYFERFYEFFQDTPKGIMNVQPEQDDVFDLRKKLPNVAITGGMTSDYLGKKSKEECIDFAKKLVDEVGANGGFIMGQNKMMTFRNDAKPENILAVQEFCRTYKG